MAGISDIIEPFPEAAPFTQPSSPTASNRPRHSSLSQRLRSASQGFEQFNLPEGFSAATGDIASTLVSKKSPRANTITREKHLPRRGSPQEESLHSTVGEPAAAAPFPNGYHFPPKHTFGQSSKESLVAFWKYFTTPLGFCVTIYGLNIVAWGGMLFLLLCNAAPAMCYPSCDHIDSPRRKWVEWDSQILNALFCVTGFGLAPWRFRDLYFLLKYRILGDYTSLRRLAGIHQGWFRLPGSETLPIDVGPQNIANVIDGHVVLKVPFPEAKIPEAPLSGIRAAATRVWKMDLVVWLMVWNTVFQVCLAVFMWHLNRYNRPAWATGLFVGLACAVGAGAGFIIFLEGKAVKSAEGVPVSEEDLQRLEQDREQGIFHYNNIKDKCTEGRKGSKGASNGN